MLCHAGHPQVVSPRHDLGCNLDSLSFESLVRGDTCANAKDCGQYFLNESGMARLQYSGCWSPTGLWADLVATASYTGARSLVSLLPLLPLHHSCCKFKLLGGIDTFAGSVLLRAGRLCPAIDLGWATLLIVVGTSPNGKGV